MGSLATIARRKPHLLHDLENLRVQIIVQDSGVLLAKLSVQSNVVKRIKLSQRDDPQFVLIMDSVKKKHKAQVCTFK